MNDDKARAALADELRDYRIAVPISDGVRDLLSRVEHTLRSPSLCSQTSVTDEMVTAAMREFERMSSVLRYREKDKWHSCDIMGMRDALRAAFALLPDPSPPPASFRRIYDKMQRGKVSIDERAKS